ncbi:MULTISPECIES: stearoyl-CoA 9-desaturase [unclassified Variovorax]|uniref:stearoyl-CoA 9-desaturase n=1 Tax=unclassified Variovorax TaxID=663243 RepID=UPI002577CC6C|nr:MULTISPECIES: stearoyl-CoA 9-desaturase [unclassified Variovorax]MDM0088660.1 stearoyl-CoA 9-desaturase [Variovorax sp. J22G40]MDM0146733.1 stearoyl-CoA 9-desaturase [Variovorax sp. J2P1-31]
MKKNTQEMFEVGLRESMRGLPLFLQPVLTWLTGKPLHEQQPPSYHFPRWGDVIFTLVLALGIVALLIYLSALDTIFAWIGIFVLWLPLVGLLRKVQVTHMHHAIHNRLFESSRLNKAYATLVSAVLFIQNSDEYRKEHLAHHNADVFTTKDDADAAFLARLGFLPGRKKDELWMSLWMTVLSPVFHLLFLQARLTSVFVRAKPVAVLLSVGAALGYAILLWIVGGKAFLLAVVLPLFPLYHISALLQFLTEHAWNVAAGPVEDWTHYAQRCWGRFCGARFPQRTNGFGGGILFVARVMVWIVKMLFLHLPVRLACLVSDLPAHDWHHLAHMAGQNARAWQSSLHLRQKAIADGDRAGFAQRELWGLPRMIAHQFTWLESIVCHYEMPGADSRSHAARK